MKQRGGARDGAGRKPTGKKMIRFWCFDSHKPRIKEFIKKLDDEQGKPDSRL
jgi:hypothetical protein